jgi:Metal-dependent hydrolase
MKASNNPSFVSTLKKALLGAFLLIAFTMQAAEPFTKITVASWNIGHFALGKAADSRITLEEARQKALSYRRFINSIGADIMAVVEYSPEFVRDADGRMLLSARDEVFSGYTGALIGPKWDYNGNAIFSNGFTTGVAETVRFSQATQPRYYIATDILIGGEKVKFVSTHLDWNQGEHGAEYRAIQIKEIIEAFNSYPYVILCADWNVGNPTEYDDFLKAGYRMANHGVVGDLLTFPAGESPRSALDNIIVKGFVPSRVRVYNEPTLSDHCLIAADLTLIRHDLP